MEIHVTPSQGSLQNAINLLPSYGGEIKMAPGEYLLDTGIICDKNYLELNGGGWGSAVIKAINPIDILKVRDSANIELKGVFLNGNGGIALSGLSFIPTMGGRNHYSSVRNLKIRECQKGLIVGDINNFSVVGLSFIGFQIDACDTAIQQNGTNTGDIFYTDGEFSDSNVVGFDMGSSCSATFRGVSTNGHNGAADFRTGNPSNTYLSIEDHIGNPTQGPFILANGVLGQQVPMTTIMKNVSISWNGIAGADIISYLCQGSLIILGGNINGDGIIRVSPSYLTSVSGPNLVDIGLVLRGNPEPRFVVTNGRRFSILPMSVNMGTIGGLLTENAFSDIGAINIPSPPPANMIRKFVRNVAGKLQYCVMYPSGEIEIISTEP